MLAELVDHVVGIDPDRDWVTLAVLDAGVPASSPRAASEQRRTATKKRSRSLTATASAASGPG